jgi:EAL domain-containing protein (putative c-di-GMP-specific phosphodiesterase class I)
LSPESFIGLAEETGMIRDIGRAVLNEAGRQLGIWQRAYRPAEPVFVAVNISSAQLIEPSLLDDVKQVLHREGLARGSFKIEVTESLVMQYPERAAQILERFRELGVGIGCDDFGTGYSSLSSLRKLPFDTLKVDRSFIAADAQDQRAVIILDSIIAMAHALGLASSPRESRTRSRSTGWANSIATTGRASSSARR